MKMKNSELLSDFNLSANGTSMVKRVSVDVISKGSVKDRVFR